MSQADFATRENIANLLINRVKLYPGKAVVEGIIPVVPDVLSFAQHVAMESKRQIVFVFEFSIYDKQLVR